MNQSSLSQPCSPQETRPCLQVVFNDKATVVSSQAFNGDLKASPLVDETAMYLSSFLDLESNALDCAHSLKVFLKREMRGEEAIAFAEILIDNPLVKEVYLRIHPLTLSELIQFVCERLPVNGTFTVKSGKWQKSEKSMVAGP